MARKNNLQVVSLPEDFDSLSSLEKSLVAKKSLFQKIFSLKISRIPAVKDKLIIVPIDDEDVVKTMSRLPRVPSNAGLIDVQWTRRLTMKNYHLQAKVDVKKIYMLLQTFRAIGNPFYQFFDGIESYRERCLQDDVDGFDNIFGQNRIEDSTNRDFSQRNCPENGEGEDIFEPSEVEAEEHNYQRNDVIRKFQIDYDTSVTLAPKFPEAFEKDNKLEQNRLIVVAPGEGKSPENQLFCKDWDAMAFPNFHPDGKANLHEPRIANLNEQMYFKQRLNNINPKFRRNSSYVFAAEYYLTKKALQRNIDLSFMRGTKRITDTCTMYSLDDGFLV